MVAAKKSKTPHFPVLESGSRGRKWEKEKKMKGRKLPWGF